MRDGVVVVIAATSDWDEGGEIDEDRDPEHDAKLNKTTKRNGEANFENAL
ncbi:MAG: hypothetical protein OHK0012_25370 [Synechococcales cyanobacterium]